MINRMQMLNFVEGQVRRVVYENTPLCAEKCNMFDNLLSEKKDKKAERLEFACFERCIGKHTDSIELGLEEAIKYSQE